VYRDLTEIRAQLESFFEPTPIGESRRALLRSILDSQRIEFQAHDIELGFGYEAGLFKPDGSADAVRDPLGRVYTRKFCFFHSVIDLKVLTLTPNLASTKPGRRLPHAWVARGDKKVSTHDLVRAKDLAWLLITGAGGSSKWADAVARAAKKTGVPLDLVHIDGDKDGYTDVDGQWAQVRGIDDDGAVLVRPDNHVAWRTGSFSAERADALVNDYAAFFA
jgi:2,4-dichlorophenol 6-monooxygenase